MPPRSTPVKRRAHSREQQPKTPLKLQYEGISSLRTVSRPIQHLVPHKTPHTHPQDFLVFMDLDIIEEPDRFCIYGTTATGSSILLQIHDFIPYFYIAAPFKPVTPGSNSPPSHYDPHVHGQVVNWDKNQLHLLLDLLNTFMHADNKIDHLEAVHKRPIMYYRPEQPHGNIYLKVVLKKGSSVKKAGNALQKAISSGKIKSRGYVWRDQTMYEHEVAPLQRLMVDVPVSAGAWLLIPKKKEGIHSGEHAVRTPMKTSNNYVSTSKEDHHHDHDNGTDTIDENDGYVFVAEKDARSSCCMEIIAPWRSIVCLTPDATQLSNTSWSPLLPAHRVLQNRRSSLAVANAADAAKKGEIAPLRVMVVDAVLATKDGIERTPVAERDDPIVAITCAFFPGGLHGNGTRIESLGEGKKEHGESMSLRENDMDDDNDVIGIVDMVPAAGVSLSAVPGTIHSPSNTAQNAARHQFWYRDQAPEVAVSFVLHCMQSPLPPTQPPCLECIDRYSNSTVIVCKSEAELLMSWQEFMHSCDPDALAVFQVKETLDAIHARCTALGISAMGACQSRMGAHAPGLYLSRHKYDKSASPKPIQVNKVTMYSAAWVKSQSRMSSTSNQETFKVENADGRIIFDVLRQILTTCNLGSFSLVDCVQSLLGQTLEVLNSSQLAELSGTNANNGTIHYGDRNGADYMRLARYSIKRVAVVHALLNRLATIPEAIEMARATGLTFSQIAYNAQMIRTWSLLLRNARRSKCIVPARPETSPMTEHTFIMHPVEHGTTGLHKEPVAILDFASLYPSIYRAYNLCYTTLLHPEDASTIPSSQIITTPTGALFVKPEVCRGILPSILAALISARSTTRNQLKTASTAAERAVLDSRQKALKVTANALYGFTGAQASPLQCMALADSCLAYGATSCRRAKDVLERAAKDGTLGDVGKDAQVIYGHTDSLFLSLPGCRSIADAVQTAQHAARLVSFEFPDPMELKFERVCAPLLLLHVNRYAGKAFETVEEANGKGGGELIVKGLKSMWRQAAPIVRTVLHGCLIRILMKDDLQGAVEFAEREIRRLLSGKVLLHELAMSGGLWRVTGQQVESAAAMLANNGGGSGPPSGESEIRGPHAALAVRISQRDPGRSFVLGERLQYVLTAGHKLQEDAAEEPLEAAKAGLQPAYDIYWKNKLQRPLSEIFACCLSSSALQSLMNGPHTLVKMDLSVTDAGLGTSRALSIGAPVGPSSPSPGKQKSKQLGMMSFFKVTAKCLGCRRAISGSYKDIAEAPGLCDECALEENMKERVYNSLIEERSVVEARQSAAHAACRACDSGLVCEDVLCNNGECPVTYERLSAGRTLRGLEVSLNRLDRL